MDWLIENRAWLFDGALVAIPLAVIGWIIANRAGANKQKQKSGRNSINIQAGGDVNLNTTRGSDDGSKPKRR